MFQSFVDLPINQWPAFSAGMWPLIDLGMRITADLFVIAPATANIIGKIANGIADDLLTTVLMAIYLKKKKWF